ncbi:MAG TPA: alpha-L-fucosidase [Chthoniobacteraceae bacterium]|jgi:alpha-L-fucosidase|nr:alpha-L-fucosidase [Chthoniobacteraceae bacterium]
MKISKSLIPAFCAALAASPLGLAQSPSPTPAIPRIIVDTSAEPIAPGKFQPTWESLSQYQTPEWFRNAKFGIWAHWGPQCEPEDGDWYARNMYIQGTPQYNSHLVHYGHPSKSGFKDIIHQWKAQNFDPEKLVALYKRAGAQYFVALADHHDNFDLWDSKYQPWNAVKIGPQKDLIAGWAKAARDNGLPFGVSVHASHAWSWYEPAQGADKTGPYAGIPYDGKLTKNDGQGLWWNGLDPQDLYAQNHPPGRQLVWDWNASKGSSIPNAAYCDKFYNRVADLIHQYHPDLIYFDDTVLPLWPISDAGLKLAADYYNTNMKLHGGKLEGVMFGKQLNASQRKCMVLDIERKRSSQIEPLPWQTDTCIGDWHYQRSLFEHHSYKSAKSVIQMLADIVSKNGNLLLSIPVRADGTIDSDELAIVQNIGKWMDVNKESIFGTRPWKVFGEGPDTGNYSPRTADDIRFTTRGNVLYAIALGVPSQPLHIASLGAHSKLLDGKIAGIALLGDSSPVKWTQGDDALSIDPPRTPPATDYATVYKITLQ